MSYEHCSMPNLMSSSNPRLLLSRVMPKMRGISQKPATVETAVPCSNTLEGTSILQAMLFLWQVPLGETHRISIIFILSLEKRRTGQVYRNKPMTSVRNNPSGTSSGRDEHISFTALPVDRDVCKCPMSTAACLTSCRPPIPSCSCLG